MCSLNSIRVSPEYILAKKNNSNEFTIIQDAFYIIGNGDFPEDLTILLEAQGKEFSLQWRKLHARVIRCETDAIVNKVSSLSGLKEVKLKVKPISVEISVPLVDAGEGSLEPMDGNDQIYYWIDSKHSIVHGVETIKGDFPIKGAQRLIESLITEPQLSKFRKRIKELPGDKVFWQNLPNESEIIKKDLLRLVYLDETRPGKEQVKELLENLLQTSIPEKKLQWELWLLKNYKDDATSDVKSVILFRSHHAYSDGSGLVHSLFMGWGVNLDTVKYPGQRLRLVGKENKKRSYGKAWKFISYPLQNTRGMLRYVMTLWNHLYLHINPPKEPAWSPLGLTSERKIEDQKIAWLNVPFDSSVMGKIATKNGVKFNSVLFAIMTGAIRKGFQQHLSDQNIHLSDKGKEQLHAYLPVNLRSAKDFTTRGEVIGNRLGAMGTPLYLEIKDNVQRMRKLNAYMEDFAGGAGAISIGIFSRIFALYPTMFKKPDLMKKFSDMYSSVFTTMPGPTEELKLNCDGNTYVLEEMNYFLPRQLVHNIPIVFSSFSYAGRVQMGVSLTGQIYAGNKELTSEEILKFAEEIYADLKKGI